ncbi:uncharacterized protein LOC124913591 [Impatiens glandulifera]|uniref:uncharacterized protein LOC124913591 n=1 Tax=Impatiens glandulifera TaxID=253017 RepID=UPI001FB17F0E|nr:uncharacterized protein LOC124913591 [Impatiens glandulifera]
MAKVITPGVDDGIRALDVSSPLMSLKSIRSLSYSKLPPQLTRLSVLKLDGSSFVCWFDDNNADVNVARNARVGDIKWAIEDLFNSSSFDGQEEIPWSQVWGYFCLSYKNKNLMNDNADIQSLGMKDNDQLRFVKHLEMQQCTIGRQQHSSANFLRCLSRPHTREVKYEEDNISIPKFRVAHLFRRKLYSSSGFIFKCYGIKPKLA